MARSLTLRLVTAAGVLAVLLVVWSLLPDRPSDAEPASSRSSREPSPTPPASDMLGGIRPVAADPATPPLEWIRGGEAITPPHDPVDAYTLAKDDESMDELMGFLEWSLPLGQGGPVGLEMARCAARFEPELVSPCAWTIEAVLRRTTEDAGVVVYARAVLSEGDEQPACRALASCSSEAWARREQTPMPPRLGDELHFSQAGRSSFWVGGTGRDAPVYYRNAATTARRALEELAAVPHDPTQVSPASIGWNLAFIQHRIDEFECMLDVLEQRPGACGT